MEETWSALVKRYRQRHGISQEAMASLLNVSQRTISRWERGEDQPSIVQQKRLRDLGWSPSTGMFKSLVASVLHCPVPRALSRTENITLAAVSKPALIKRPSVADWIGRDLAPLACGVLQQILDDQPLQRAIAAGEIAGLITTTRSVLKTTEHESIGLYRTTITYFFHEGTLYSDAIGVPSQGDDAEGYVPITMDEIPTDFG